MNDFEQRLQSRRPRQIPESWRQEILSHARDVVAHETSCVSEQASGIRHPASGVRHYLSLITHHLSTFLWPHPKAWAGLAAVWLLIGWLNWSATRSESSVLTAGRPESSAVSPGQLASLTEQRRLQRELLGLIPVNASEVADRPKSQPALKPQSAVPQTSGFA